jgi:hypothetical protein
MADQQLYGGTQSALSTTLLLWRSSVGADGVPIVEEQHCRDSRLLLDDERWRLRRLSLDGPYMRRRRLTEESAA